MANRNLNIGDIFSIKLEDHSKLGYGKIIKIDKPIVFIDLYKVDTNKGNYTLEELQNANPLLSIWSTSNGFKKGEWNVVGNSSVNDDYEMPNFWMKSPSTGELILIPGGDVFEAPKNTIKITEDQIGDAQPYGVFGDIAVKNAYIAELVKYGLY